MNERERDRLRYKCPSCKNETLVIDAVGLIICSLIGCKEPDAFHKMITNADSELSKLKEQLETAQRQAEKFKIMAEAKLGIGVWLCPSCNRGTRSGHACPDCLENQLSHTSKKLERVKAILTRLINVGRSRANVLYKTAGDEDATESFLLQDFRRAEEALNEIEKE